MKRLNLFLIKQLIKVGTRIGVYGTHMLSYCVKNKMICEADILIDRGIGLGVVDEEDNTPLHIAINGDMNDLVKKMVAKGVDLCVANADGKRPLHIAVGKGNFEIVEILIGSNANVNAKDKFFRTPLHYAAIRNDKSILKLLIDNGASVDERDLNGETPLHRSVKYNRSEVEEILLDNSGDINIVNKYGCNLLHMAINGNNFGIIPKLISRGIDVNKENVVGETPLLFAVRKRNTDVAKLLIENGASMRVMENLKEVELVDIAMSTDCRDMVMLLVKNGVEITKSLSKWVDDRGYRDILREIDKRIAVDNNDIDKLRSTIQSEKRDVYKYDNIKLLEIAIEKGREEIASILMYNLTNDKIGTLKRLAGDNINSALKKTVSKAIRRDRNFCVIGLVLDYIYQFKAREKDCVKLTNGVKNITGIGSYKLPKDGVTIRSK